MARQPAIAIDGVTYEVFGDKLQSTYYAGIYDVGRVVTVSIIHLRKLNSVPSAK